MNDRIQHDDVSADWTFAVVGGSAEPAFDRLTSVAARLFTVPTARLTLFQHGQHWTKSHHGPALSDLPRYDRLCDAMIGQAAPMMIADVSADLRFVGATAGDDGSDIRFFAGAILTSSDGMPLGALCVTDVSPLGADAAPHGAATQLAALADLAALAIDLIEARRQGQVVKFVAPRTVAADTLLLDIARAPRVDAGLEAVVRALGQAHHAVGGELWRRTADRSKLARVSRYGARVAAEAAACDLGDGVVASALRQNQPVAVALGSAQSHAGDPLLIAARGQGARQLLVVPLVWAADAYVAVLGFEHFGDLTATRDEVAAVVAALHPGLVQKSEEERLRLLGMAIDRASQGVTIMRAAPPGDNGAPTINYANDSFCRMFGYAAADLIGKSPEMLHGPDTCQETVQQLRAAQRRSESCSATLVRSRRDGSSIAVDLESAPIIEPDQSVKYFVVLQRDVTTRGQRLRELRAVNESFRLMFEENPLPMWVFDARTLQFLTVNRAAIDFYGWSREVFLTMRLHDVCVDEVLDSKSLAGQRSMKEPGTYTHRLADGSLVRINGVTGTYVLDGQDAIFTVLWDVTAAERARAEQQRSYQLLGDLTDQLYAKTVALTDVHRLAQLGSWRLSADRQEMTWSDEIYALLDRRPSEFPASFENSLAVLHPDDRHLYERSIPVRGSTGGSRCVEARIVRPDGHLRHVRIEFRPLDADDPRGDMIGYVQDVTERWETQQALLRSERLAILGHLTGGVAHDFNNLLTVVTLNLEEVIAELPEADELREILVAALRSAQRGSDLTTQLLAYARQAPLRPQATSLAGFFKSFAPVIRRTLGQKYKLRVELEADAATPLVDATQLQNALLNLALNARDAMPDGGEVVIEYARVVLPSPDFPLAEAASGEHAMISVTDQGCGIAPKLIPRIFEPFYTTKAPGAGGGLGLSMVDGFIAQSGGRIMVRSEVGKGTTIRLFLPLPAVQAAGPTASEGHAGRPRVLVVEDQPAVLATVSRMFKQLGYEVRGVGDAASALDELARDDKFDVLFSDIVLPGELDGIALSTEVARRAPAVRILLTSGFSEHHLGLDQLPRCGILMKPYGRKDLLNRLNEVLAGSG